jgi:tripartite-type tricarboxylate transporter receptor subunit TctC
MFLVRLVVALALLFVAGLPTAAMAQQGYPNKPIRIVVGFPPGIATDVVARLIAQKLTELNGWAVIVENKPGQSGSVGAADVARAAPDGYTLLFTATSPMATNPNLYKNIRYDSTKDFTAIILAVNLPFILSVNASSPIKSVDDLLRESKANPKALNYATPGVGSTAHLITAMFSTQTGAQLTHVPYKSSSEMLTAVISGQVHMMFDSAIVTIPQAKGGKLRPLAVSTAARVSTLPDVPTLAEGGLAGFDMAAWLGMVGPAGMPREIVQRLNQDIAKILAMPDFRARMAELGAEVLTSTPEEFAGFIRTELVKWGKAVKDSGASVE